MRRVDPAPCEGDQTTHFSIVDKDGNAVANTYTLNFSYGLGLVAEGTGVVLNNELDDFAAKPGAPNAFGLNWRRGECAGAEQAAAVVDVADDRLERRQARARHRLARRPAHHHDRLGMILDIIDFGMNIAEATDAPRIHHQWLPDELRVERGLSPDTLRLLRAKGQNVVEGNAMGSTATITMRDGWIMGAADTRQRGTLAVGY